MTNSINNSLPTSHQPSNPPTCPEFTQRVKNLFALASASWQKANTRQKWGAGITFTAAILIFPALPLLLFLGVLGTAAYGGRYHKNHTSIESENAKKEFEKAIDTATREEMTKALPGPLEDPEEKDPAIRDFTNEVIFFSAEIKAKKLSQEELRAKLAQFKNSPAYASLLAKKHPTIQFLHSCFLHLNSTDAQKALKEYGEATFGSQVPLKDQYQIQDLVHLLEEGFGPIYNRDNWFDCLMWAMNHPERATLNLVHGEDPDLNCHHHNPTYLGMPLTVHGKKLDYQLGPGPTGTSSIHKNGLIEAYKTFGVAECRFSHQSTHKKGEYERVKEAHSWQKGNEEVFGHVSLSFDRGVKQPQNLRELQPFGEDEGITIPKHLLSDQQLKKALATADEIIATCKKDKKEVDPRIVNRIQDAVLARAVLLANPRFDRMASPCKQHFDRGTANSLITYYFDRLINRQSLTREDLLKIAGVTRVRPHVTEDRAPLKKRIGQAIATLKFLSESEEKVQQVLMRFENA